MSKVRFIFRQFYVWVLTLLILVTCFFSTSTIKVFADTGGDFAKTNIEDDLRSIGTVNYEDFLHYDSSNAHRVIAVSEYCYSDIPEMSKHYGLYIYVWNRYQIAINANGKNQVNMAVSYDDQNQPEYKNWDLVYCDRSDGSVVGYADYEFYKFKVEDSATLLKEVNEYATVAHEYNRRYDIVGVQLQYATGDVIKDEGCGKTLYFSGYAKGCNAIDPEAPSTLTYRSEDLDTLQLDVTTTNWRGDFNDYHTTDLQTAFFTIPNSYFEKYGSLQGIKAEWYEYKTKNIFVTSDEEVFDDNGNSVFDAYLGKNIGNGTEALPWVIVWEEYYPVISLGSTNVTGFKKAYNRDNGDNYEKDNANYFCWGDVDFYVDNYAPAETVPEMYYILPASGTEHEAYYVSGEVLEEYMWNYTQKYGAGKETVSGGRRLYAKELFEDSIDDTRVKALFGDTGQTCGYVCQDIQATDTRNILLKKDQGWWDKLWHGTKYEEQSLDAIVTIDSLSLLGDKDDFEETFKLTNKETKDKTGKSSTIFEKAETAIKKGETAVLFRFAVTDYYSSSARFEYSDNDGMSSQDGYVAQETVFLGFDVISLTFCSNTGNRTVIGAVSNPIDVINGLTPPDDLGEDESWWKRVLMIIALLVVLAIFAPVLLPFLTSILQGVLKLVLSIVKIPFNVLGSIFRRR